MAQMQGNGNRTQGQPGAQPSQNRGPDQTTGVARRGAEQGMQTRPMRRAINPFAALRSMSPLMASSPFGMVRRVFDDMERMMESMISDYDEPSSGMAISNVFDFVPRIDITRRGDQILVHADLPGMSPQDLRIHATEDGLVIEGERQLENERRNIEGDIWQSERSYGRFYRVIPLPDGADVDNAQARFENGVLEVSIKVPEGQRRGRQIPIQGTSSGPSNPSNPSNPSQQSKT
jgi:HSP20 family protein